MEWSEKETLRLIDEIRCRDIIWSPNHPERRMKHRKEDALDAVATLFPPSTKGDILNKWRNLCQTYRTCRRKVKNFKRSSVGLANVYTPTWFAFGSMNAFMKSTYTPVKASNTVMSPQKLLQKKKPLPVVDQAEALSIACQFLKTKSIETPKLKLNDECSMYGTLIAEQLRQMDEYTRKHTMHDINNIIFKNSISPISPMSPSSIPDIRSSATISAQNYLHPSQTNPSPSSQVSSSPSPQAHLAPFSQIYSPTSPLILKTDDPPSDSG